MTPSYAKSTVFLLEGRKFIFITPDRLLKKAAPLLVALHGCKQDASIFLNGTGLKNVAESHEFYLLVPEQSVLHNIDHCWNWFLNFNQDYVPFNEMEQIISGIEFIKKSYLIDLDKIFVAGMSAGGAMAHNLTACYPDYFSGSVIHSGLAYKSAETLTEAQSVMTSTNQKTVEYLGKKMFECSRRATKHRLKKVLVIHGEDDPRVLALHGQRIQKVQEVWRDYLDDGKRNFSAKNIRTQKSWKFPNGYTVEQTDIIYKDFAERFLLVKGLKHAWGGGPILSNNFDPLAPSSNNFILSYFGLNN